MGLGKVRAHSDMADPIRSFRDLIVWQKSMDVAVDVVLMADHLKEAGSIVLADQMHRSAVSVPSNIAEGHGRRSRREYARFIQVALGSLRELMTQLEVVRRTRKKYADVAVGLMGKTDEVGKMLYALHISLQRPPKE